MSTLSPIEAAEIAFRVYDVRSVHEDVYKVFDKRTRDTFTMPDNSRFEGISGGVILHTKTGFGIAAR